MRVPVISLLLILLAFLTPLAAQDQPLHVIIDEQCITAGAPETLCADPEFLRRVSLDLIGMPPDAEQVRAFVSDSSPDKRLRVIEELLRSPLFDRHLATTLDLMLMERRANTHVPQESWFAWLHSAVRENRPWNEVVREILRADGMDEARRGPARFFLDRQSEPHLLTRDIGRIFFGRDMKCAQCHNHPLIDDYHQADYHGLHAFLAPGYAVVRKVTKQEGDKETTADVTVHAERAGTDLEFASVFFEETRHRTGPRLPGGPAIEEPFFYPGEEYEIAPAEGVRSIPKSSRRETLAALTTRGDNRMFNENIANRMWAHMLGRGLVDPLDLHHPDNSPTRPELLRLLGDHIAATNYDLRGLLREIALSRTYQRPFDRPDDLSRPASIAGTRIAELESEKRTLDDAAARSLSEFEDALGAWYEAESNLIPQADQLDAARKACADARTKLVAAEETLATSQSQREREQSAREALQQAVTAAQAAAAELNNDSELTAAAETLARRASGLDASLEQLNSTITEQTAAAEQARTESEAARNALDTAANELAPLAEHLRQAEQLMVAAREIRQRDATAAAAVARRLQMVEAVAQLAEREEAVATAVEVVTEREHSLDIAVRSAEELVAGLDQLQAAAAEAGENLSATRGALSSAQNALNARREDLNAVEAAVEAARVANGRLPEDPALVQAVDLLQARLTNLQAEMEEPRRSIETATAAVSAAEQHSGTTAEALTQAEAESVQRHQVVSESETRLASARNQLAECRAGCDAAIAGVTDRWAAHNVLASLKPLTPEQFCWSILKVTGVYDRYRTAEIAELDQASPLTEEQRQDPQQVLARNREIEQRTYDKLKGNVGTFVRYYGAGTGQPQGDFFATADQALFAANGGAVNSWIAPTDGNVTHAVVSAGDASSAAEALYLGVLSRYPTPEEISEVAKWLAERPEDRETVAREMVWGLLTSIEFRFNH